MPINQRSGTRIFSPVNEFIHPWQPGQWYLNQLATGNSHTTVAVVAGRLYAIPIYIPQLTTIASIGLNVGTLSAGNVRLGLYTDSNGYPAALQFDSGSIATGTTGDKTYSPAWTPSYIGWHWVAAVFSATPSVISNSNNAIGPMLLGSGSFTDVAVSYWLYTTFAFAALPDPFPGSPTYHNNQPIDLCLKI